MPQTENYEYSISELLGSGSFGNVYKVNGSTFVFQWLDMSE